MTCFSFIINGQHFGLPLEAVDEALPMAWVERVAESPAEVCGVLDVRGTVVAVVDPAYRLGAPRREPKASDFLVLVKGRSGRLALRVDALVGLVEGELEPAPPAAEGPVFVAGLLREGGALITVLSLDDFLKPEVRAFAERLRDEGRTA